MLHSDEDRHQICPMVACRLLLHLHGLVHQNDEMAGYEINQHHSNDHVFVTVNLHFLDH